MWRIVISVITFAYLIYVIMVLGQAWNLIKFTNRKITVKRMLIPFYYWIASTNEKQNDKN